MEIEQLVKILFFALLLVVLIYLVIGMAKGNFTLFEKLKEILTFR
jgi:hypothetical protein